MFHKDKSKTKVSLSEVKSKNTNTLTQITLPKQLLILPKRQQLIDEFKAMLELPRERFEEVGESLLMNLAAYLQELPETRNSYFSTRAGFLNHAFSRTQAALNSCRAYFVSDDGKPAKTLSPEQQRWMYTLFSAALLKGVGKVFVDFLVELYDSSGDYVGRWAPLKGSMRHQGGYFYDYDFDVAHQGSYRRRVTLLLARQIMPDAGFEWLSEDKDVLEIWLALLEDDSRDAGTLGMIMDKADAIAINRFFSEMAVEHFNKREGDIGIYAKKETTFGSSEKDLNQILKEGDVPQAGIEFVKWLNRSLATARLMINQSPLFMVPGGLLMSPDVFQLFIREHPQFKSWVAVQQGLTQMQLHSTGPNGEIMQKFVQNKTGQAVSGVVISQVGVVTPQQMKMVNLKNGAVKSVTSTQLGQMKGGTGNFAPLAGSPTSAQTLSSKGQWTTPAGSIQSPLNPGQKT